MLTFKLEDLDAQRTLGALVAAGANLRPLMLKIGEGLSDSTKDRFASTTAPDGSKWLPNKTSTILAYLQKTSGNFNKDGRLNKRGASRVTGKNPLTGISKALRTTINYNASEQGVNIGSPEIYASTQQFGAPARSFKGGKSPWGTIPARPFLGISAADEQLIIDATLDFLDSI